MKRALRVAVDARSLLCAQPRGEGKSLLRLYEEIALLRPDVEVILYGDDRAANYAGPLPKQARCVEVAAVTTRLDIWEDVLFPARALLAGCSVMHCASSSAPRHTFIPSVMTVHDLIPMVFDDGHNERERQCFERRLRTGLREARRVVAVSDNTRRDLLSQFPGHTSQIDVVHWGGDAVCGARPVGGAPPTVLLFGGEARRKNTEYAVDRFIAAAERVPTLRLELIGMGAGRLRTSVMLRLERSGLGHRASVPGFISEAELLDIVHRSSMLLYLSLYEGFGLPVLEAIGHGLPVVASDRTSIPEILNGVPGAFSLDDKNSIEDIIVKLATDEAFRIAMVESQRGVLQRFNWQDTANRYIDILESLP